ncbi:2,2-dialkylglycine decarboxylase (pyruvate) [Fusarium austroafricanum]|uniref:2,2-dialkylglycine decarboxylase (Pyruvate) n=1 Tax=Fusarium austroafricanum TaxID=2364996 RepID=A0A8H4K1P6_9HYPO|nr:2,2-dialkylglycine decarboxylase (pyruvate) [Fusarium austroafricanum]
MESILSTEGILDLPKGYLKRVQNECRKRGRTGKMFAFEHEEGAVPDILALSKTLGGLPLFSLIITHLTDPLTAAVGDKVLEIVERDNICQKANRRGQQLRAGLEKLQRKSWCIGDLGGRSLLRDIEIISDPKTKAAGADLGQAGQGYGAWDFL